MTSRPSDRSARRRRDWRAPCPVVVVPPDPARVLDGPLDPDLLARPGALRPHRDRLWLRRLVRRAWIALAAVVVAELVLWTIARFVPLPSAPLIGAAIPVVGLLGWLIAGRPRATAHRRDGAGRRCRGGPRRPGLERARAGGRLPGIGGSGGRAGRADADADDGAARRGRRDRSIRPAPTSRRAGRRPPGAAVAVPAAVLAPAGRRRGRRAAAPRAGPAHPEPAGRGHRPAAAGPRGRRATGRGDRPRRRRSSRTRAPTRTIRGPGSPRSCATSRASSASARTTSTSTSPVSEPSRPRFAPRSIRPTSSGPPSLTSLSRALSSAATGKPDANKDGDPEKARDDLKDLGDKLDELTPEQQKDLARQLAEMEATASQADGAAGTALSQAAQSLAQGDTAGREVGARSAR